MTSNLPNSLTAKSTADLMSISFPTSAFTASAFTLGKRAAIKAAPFSAFARFISTRTTFAPSCAKSMADSKPIPLQIAKIDQPYERSVHIGVIALTIQHQLSELPVFRSDYYYSFFSFVIASPCSEDDQSCCTIQSCCKEVAEKRN